MLGTDIFHNYGAKTLFNGIETYTRISIREDKNGEFYYDNHSITSEQLKKAPQSRPLLNANQAVEIEGLSKDRLYQWWHGVNENSALRKILTDDEVTDLKNLTKSKDFKVILPSVESSVNGDAVELHTLEAHEVVRTLLSIVEDKPRDAAPILNGAFIRPDILATGGVKRNL